MLSYLGITMRTIRFGDEIGYKAETLIQKRAECDFQSKFLQAKKNIGTNSNLMAKAISFHDVYLFYHYGWGQVKKDNISALKSLRQSMALGYPLAGIDLARHYLKRKNLYKAKDCITKCKEEFFNRDKIEQEKHKEEYNDMMQLLKVIESETNTENSSDGESIEAEEEFCSDSISSPSNPCFSIAKTGVRR